MYVIYRSFKAKKLTGEESTVSVFTTRFREFVDANGGQTEMSKRIHVNRSTIGSWYREESYPSANHLELISREYNVSIDYLLGRIHVNTDNIQEAQLSHVTKLNPQAMNTLLEMCRDNLYRGVMQQVLKEGDLLHQISKHFYRAAENDYQAAFIQDSGVKGTFQDKADLQELKAIRAIMELLERYKKRIADKKNGTQGRK